MEPIRSAASPEGMIVVGIIYFIIWVFGKLSKKSQDTGTLPKDVATTGQDPTQQEGLSLERILQQIQQVKQQAEVREQQARLPPQRPSISVARTQRPPQPNRERPKPVVEGGPMGRHSRTRLPASEDVEERDTLEGGTLEVAERVENLDNRQRQRVDQDEGAEALVQRRIAAAEARNQPLRSSDHKAFDKRIREPAPTEKVERRYSASSMRDAFVWREILGPPKSLE